jgi:hypothetical protein
MIRINAILYILFAAVLVLLPFTAFFDLFPSLNPYAQQLSFFALVLLLGAMIFRFIFSDKVINIPMYLLNTGAILLLIGFLSFLINYTDILKANLNGKTGVNLFVNNFLQIFFGVLTVYTFCFVARISRKGQFERIVISSIFTITLLSCIYCFFELISYHGILTDLFDRVASIFHHDKIVGSRVIDNQLNYGRVKGFTQEPSHLGIIFALYFPYLIFFSDTKGKRLLVLVYVTLMFFTYSKTLYLIFLIQIILYLYIKNRPSFSFVIIVRVFPIILLIMIIAASTEVYLFFVDSSSVSRGTSQLAAILGWIDSGKYIFGEGLGQHGFYTYAYYMEFGGINNEFVNVLEGERWPFIQNIHIKVLVELGIIGFIFWLFGFYFFFEKINYVIKLKYITHNENDIYGKATIIALVGLFFAGFSYENFSFLFTWVGLGLFASYTYSNLIIHIGK